jgi:hypothetical protein
LTTQWRPSWVRRGAAIVGVGPARTLNVLHAVPYRHIQAIEYSPAILATARAVFSGVLRPDLRGHGARRDLLRR